MAAALAGGSRQLLPLQLAILLVVVVVVMILGVGSGRTDSGWPAPVAGATTPA